MESLKPYKNILIGGGVLLLVFGGYMFWRNRSVSNPDSDLQAFDVFSGGSSAITPQAAVAGQQIISILNDLRQLRIDKGVFENLVFKSLVDYTIATTSEDKGRPDPFAPLPFELATEEDQTR